MKGKLNLKTIIIFAILILVIVLSVLGVNMAKTFISGAAADYEPKNLTAISSADGGSATVSWITDKAATASVFYGTNMASLLLMAEDSSETTDHRILLSNLRANKTYYYKIVVGDNEFDNGGTMFTFKTEGQGDDSEDAAATSKPTIAPVVTLPATITPSVVPTAAANKPATTSPTPVCDHTTDYVKDGVVNSLDYISCMRGKVTPTKSPSGT